ncbi:FAD-dependent monooxygenase [Streptomyces caatingaensis]|uniref:FAD-dependent oxidoreductase n=1 Tax=Streptomyces caatingaensis TaxID=1678637 RepID=A0A0K9XGM9_9ACTN|nr:FAD-dependent monooxygenase [Streptomyces caatingaensis]KNB52574.1 FAD-dependent oxidoreductase [Streptomyces caatingaensis]
MTHPEVIVVGAGPTGLTLANELGLAGVRTLVLERTLRRSGQSKALNLQPRTAEMFDLRGWLDPLADRALTALPWGHFAGIALDYGALDTRFPYQVGIPQARVEGFLEDRLAAQGVPVLRGHELTGFAQDAGGVSVTAEGPGGARAFRAAYLVGADGGRSRVRKELGVGFPGRDARVSLAVADVELEDDPALPTEWRPPPFEAGHGPTAALTPLGDGVFRFVFGGVPYADVPRDAPVTEDEVRAALNTGPGHHPRLRALRWGSRFTDASRQAESYVDGRVLLAGDAAHVHLPAGGQGLNLGVQDAFNLGWKLAAVVRGRGPEGLLGSYHDERHPVGAAVLENTRAQGALALPDVDARAVRAVVADLLSGPEANRRVAGLISGLDLRYPMPGAPAHPLLGRRLPRLRLPAGRGLLLGPDASPLRGWADRVDWSPAPDRVLVRPDGYVCWAGGGEGAPEGEGPEPALRRWFGAPS